ncbi:MAG: thiol:disulfide interchange protein DsbA/DsbL [Gammaproteobacteria bacterium]|nr:thiol:disulfide interchange protein DsbA/DsbL [Gammaproteobacteria bacterium]
MGRLTIFTAFLAISLPLAIPLPATAEITVPIVAKMHYEAIETPLTTEDSDRVEVTEFFSYACVHCYNFDPVLDAWRSRQPADVAFRRVPAIFYESWKPFAQAYYTAVALGIAEESHMAFFEAVHVEQRQLLKTYNSFGIRSRVQNAMAHSRAYGTGVPTVIVNGKYRVHGRLDGLQGKGFEDLLAVVDFLVEQERKAETQ